MTFEFARSRQIFKASSLLAASVLVFQVQAFDVTFSEDAVSLNLTHFGQTHGQSWGDYNADGYADLFISYHGQGVEVFRNEAGLGFTSVNDLISADLTGDMHGGAWGDFDNDGDRDLLFVEGASGGTQPSPSRLLVNTNGTFVDQAGPYNLEQLFARARAAGWIDWNNDGLLDATLTNFPSGGGATPTSIYTRTGNTFVSENDNAGYHPIDSNTFATLVKTNTQDEPVLLVNTVFFFPEGGMYDMTQLPFINLTQELGVQTVGGVWDFAVADFDGDLDQEIFLPSQTERSEVIETTESYIQTSLLGLPDLEQGFTFESSGIVSFDIGPNWAIPLSYFAIGENSLRPDSLVFTLDSSNPDNWGTPPEHNPAIRKIYIYFTPAENRWTIEITNRVRFSAQITTDGVFSAVQPSASSQVTFEDGGRPAKMLKQTEAGYVDISNASGVAGSYPCMSAAVADYDNDMDVDIYMSCAGSAANIENILLENDGTGVFTAVDGAAGATGSVVGRADAANTADFNNDGFIDILVTNGFGTGPNGAGPTELFINGGNDNHWIHLDLEGVSVNRDGVGAWVVLTAGGKSQSRLQSNGARRYGQDDQRLHFGLGDNTVIDEIVVRWPGGQTQTITNVAVDQILKIVQEIDSDGDSVLDEIDNCQFVANPLQTDADADGFGNRCDPDLNNDLIVNFLDVSLFSQVFLTGDAVADFNSDGVVNFVDLALLGDFYLLPPGP